MTSSAGPRLGGSLLVSFLVAVAVAAVRAEAAPCSDACGGWFAGASAATGEVALSLHDSPLLGLHRDIGGPGDGMREGNGQRPLFRAVLKVGREASTHAVIDVASHVTVFETATCLARSDPAARCTAHPGIGSSGWQLPSVSALGLDDVPDKAFEVSRGVTLWGRCGCGAGNLQLAGGGTATTSSAPIFAVTGVSAAARATSTQANAIVGLAPAAVRKPFVIKASAASAAAQAQLIVDAAAPVLAVASSLSVWSVEGAAIGLRLAGSAPDVAPPPLSGLSAPFAAAIDTTIPVAALPAQTVEAIVHAVAGVTGSVACAEPAKLATGVLGLGIGAGARLGFLSGTAKALDATLPSLEVTASGRTASVPATRYMRSVPCARQGTLVQLPATSTSGAAGGDDGDAPCWCLGIDTAEPGAPAVFGVAVVLAAPDGVRFDPAVGASFVNPADVPSAAALPKVAADPGAWWTPRSQGDAPAAAAAAATETPAPDVAHPDASGDGGSQPVPDSLTLQERTAMLRDGGSAWSAHNGVVLVLLACGGLCAIVAFVRIRDRRLDWESRPHSR